MERRPTTAPTGVDLALRYGGPGQRMQGGKRLCGEQLDVVASRWLLQASGAPKTPSDLARFTLIEAGDAHRSANLEWLSGRRWFDAQACGQILPKRWLYFNYAHQMVQAALAGPGLALARIPLIADALASGDLIEVMSGHRLASPLAYWLLTGPRSAQRPQVQAFCAWLALQAQSTRHAIGDGPDHDTLATPD